MGVLRGFVGVLAVLAVTGAPVLGADSKGPAAEDWEGALKVGPVSLRLVFHVVKGADGTLSATMDSPDQGATGLKVDTASNDGKVLTFELKGLAAKFTGKVGARGNEAVGAWSQGVQSFPLTLRRSARTLVAAGGKEQVWEGKLNIGAGLSLRMVFHIRKDDAGKLTATADSPDQGATGLKVDDVTLDKTTLSLTMKALRGSFSGKLDPSGTTAVGEWTQGGQKLPLTLDLVEKVSEVRRPQTPKPPYPYVSETVTYENKSGKVKLAGTLTLPRGKGPFPAVILISGSGAQDRDESLFEHRPFAVIADALTRRGVAVLRVDDRGVGGSTGDPATSTTEDFAGDVQAGVDFLKARKEVDARRIGLLGHSEGGVIAPMVAARSKDVAFIVLLAGTGLPGDEIIMLQADLIGRSLGMDPQAMKRQLTLQKKLLDVVKAERDDKAAEAKLKEAVKEFKATIPKDQLDATGNFDKVVERQTVPLRGPWFHYFLNYDPRPVLKKVTVPVLALVGERDLQVPPKENLAEIEKALKSAGNTDVTVRELAGLNHLFQSCKTGSPAEYATIEETFSPEVLELIGDWVVSKTIKIDR